MLTIRGMELHAKWRLLIVERVNHLSILCVPKMNKPIEPCAQKLISVICETNVFYGFLMTHVGPQTLLIRHDIPNLTSAIVAR